MGVAYNSHEGERGRGSPVFKQFFFQKEQFRGESVWSSNLKERNNPLIVLRLDKIHADSHADKRYWMKTVNLRVIWRQLYFDPWSTLLI